MDTRKAYPSDMTNDQWALLGPMIPGGKPNGRPREVNMREIVNALFYINRNGCVWRALPHDLPPWKTVYNYFRAFNKDGTWQRIMDKLRETIRVEAGSEPTPSLGHIDSQSVKTTEIGGQDRGYDAGKNVDGRKRHILVDKFGLLIAVVVTAAHLTDAFGAKLLLSSVAVASLPRMLLVKADSAYGKEGLAAWIKARLGWVLNVVCRAAGAVGWVLLPERFVVERTFGWFNRYRRLSKDYERRIDCSEAMIRISQIHLMLNRIKPKAKPGWNRFSQRFRYDEKEFLL